MAMHSGIAGRSSGELDAVQPWASTRERYLDNLKVILIAAIIAMHAVLGYASIVEVWSYTSVREVTLATVTQIVLFVLVSPLGLILIALLFLIAGLLARQSLHRKGIPAYVRARLLRLGLPFVLYVLVIQPALMYGLEHPLGAAPGTYWREFLGAENQLDTGPLWFVGVLLIFSLGYAGWVGLQGDRTTRPPKEITARRLILVTAAVAITSFLVRLIYPYGGDSGFADLNLWQWPTCVVMFGLGIAASRRGWLAAVPARLDRHCQIITGAAALAMASFLFLAGALDKVDEAIGGWGWMAAVFAVIECTLSVYGSVWLLATAQRRLRRPIPQGALLGRSAYGAFVVQTAVLLGLAVALRPVPLPAEIKAVFVAAGGVTGSFALAGFLIRRVPGVARVL
ncbi:MAG: acyltransferase family protein [Micromonosporaceae bacterium]